MDAKTIIDSISNEFSDSISNTLIESEIRVSAYVSSPDVVEVCRYLKESLGFDHLSCESVVDYIKRDEFEVVYHIASYDHPVVLTLKAILPRDNPVIDSIVDVYWNANWYERENYELYGVSYTNHPYLKVLVLPEEMLGEWPLRKDYEGFPQKTAKNLV